MFPMYGLVCMWITNTYNYLYIPVVTGLFHAALLLIRYLSWRQILREVTQDISRIIEKLARSSMEPCVGVLQLRHLPGGT